MFDVGLSELLVIGLVALIVIGPKRLPEVARAAGRWAGRLQRFVSDVKQDLDRELHQAELSELRQLKQELDETRRVMEDSSGRLMQDLQAVPAGINAAAHPNTIAPPADDSKEGGGTTSGTKEVERRRKQSPRVASGDGRDAGGRATPGAVAGTATEPVSSTAKRRRPAKKKKSTR
ncbi:MAG: twin-arginine translocase subunit TatB, partial [Gammaproteobacteria bacterium]|nr:twin-arginine translocase subunit TatB [Gammaproteobacteria bacterium]